MNPSLHVLKELLKSQKKYLDYFFEHVDLDPIQEVLELLYHCEGIVLFSGVGKSGLVAEKIAVTMTSTGQRALYLSPTNALHGDIGFVNKNDVFVMLSKSGESDELLNLLPFLRNRGAKIVAMVSGSNSRLAKAADYAIVLPLEKELCPFDLAPTTSALIQMIVGDLLVIGLMKKKEISLDDYAVNHPAGQIGKRATLQVKDLMLTDDKVPVCRPGDKLVDSLVELSNKQCGCILVVDEAKQLQGIFTDGDLRRALQQSGAGALEEKIESFMTQKPRFITPEARALEAMSLMEEDQKHPITILPVLEGGSKVVGVIKMHDIVQSGL